MKFNALSKPANRWTLFLAALATALAGATYVVASAHLNRSREMPTVSAPIVQQVSAIGRLEPTSEVINISSPSKLGDDRVAQLLVKRGEQVSADQVIAVMESQNQLESALLEAKAQLKVSQAELAQVQAGNQTGKISAQQAEVVRLNRQLTGSVATQEATISRWVAEVNAATTDYDRYLSLYQKGATSQSDLEQRRLALESAQAQLNEANAEKTRLMETTQEQIQQASATLDEIVEVRPVDVQMAQASVEQAIAAVNRAEVDLATAYVRAPIAGRILDVFAQPGEVVPEEGIVEIGQTEQMQIVAEVYQTDVGRIYEGQDAVVTSEAFSGQIQGTVQSIGLKVSSQEVASGQPGENLDQKVISTRISLNPEDSQRIANLTNLQVQVIFSPEEQAVQR